MVNEKLTFDQVARPGIIPLDRKMRRSLRRAFRRTPSQQSPAAWSDVLLHRSSLRHAGVALFFASKPRGVKQRFS